MPQSTILLIVGAAILLALLATILILRGRKQNVALGDIAIPPPPRAQPRAIMPEDRAPDPLVADPEIIVAFDAAPVAGSTAPAIPPVDGDPLTRIKGLGPKAAARLAALGVTRFDQIGAWSDTDIATIDAQMGPFQGRIARDRWVDQARLLANGEREAFEARFGSLGG